MSREIFNSRDAVSAQEGEVYCIIDNTRYKYANVIDIEVNAKPETGEIKTLKSRQTKKRSTSVSVEGKMTMQWVDSSVQNMILQLITKGVEVYFDVQGVHEDPSSSSGRNVYLFPDCILDGDIPLFKADSNGGFLEQEVSFFVNGTPQQLEGFSNSKVVTAG